MRTTLGAFARALTVMGLLSLAFGLFQARIGDISERRSQRALRASLTEMLNSGAGLGRDAKGNSTPIMTGTAVALLDIPRIDLHKVVVEGASAESLKKGPGVISSSVLPGQPGQTIVVGRRTTFGAPFRHLDVLAAGDEIQATTPFGKFNYKVSETHTVGVGSSTTFNPTKDSLLTLVTSDPPYVGGSALVVAATLQGQASSFPDPNRVSSSDAGRVALVGNAGSEPGAAIAGVLLLAALIVTEKLYRRWRRWPTYLLTTPVILALLFAWMENLTSLFPSSL
jgi:sortase A